jgi:hypothetical protein
MPRDLPSFDRIEALLAELQGSCDERGVGIARDIVTTLLEVHAEGFSRMLTRVAAAGDVGQEMLRAFGRDEVLGSLLLLHGQHPEPLESRLRRGLESARASLAVHGAGVELLGIQKGVITVRLKAAPHDQPPFLRATIEDALLAVAPDLDRIDIVIGDDEPHHEPRSALIPADRLVRRAPVADQTGEENA